jgi:hypothetical protein
MIMMKTYKRWTMVLLGVLVAFLGLNAAIWTFFTRDILTFDRHYSGDLGRLGYIVGSNTYRKPERTLPRVHIENTEYHGQHVDVVTIGDSFSNLHLNGRDPLYQDWIASLHNLDVLNVQPIPGMSVFETAVILMNSGYLDKVKPRYLILERVERECIGFPYQKLDFSRSGDIPGIEQYYRVASSRFNPPTIGFVNTGNFKFLRNSLLYRFSDHAFISQVYVRDLTEPMFTVKDARRLLFFKDDVLHLKYVTDGAIGQFNDDLNTLADRLASHGIRLYFLPAADKYNIYSDYIVNNPYPKSRFFEVLRTLPKRYVFVDTKALLEEDVRKGEKDIYYADDTHWSWKAVKIIVEHMQF